MNSSSERSADYALLALAGLVQAATLVHALANGRPVDADARRATLDAILTHHAQSLQEIFPAAREYRLGLRTLSQALSGTAITPEVARYTLQLLDLARRLHGSQPTSARLGQLLNGLAESGSSPSALAEIYRQTIGNLGKRIQVTGDPERLRQEAVANEIRAQLLAGVRFAWLWRQLGGRRWHLILRRRSLLVALQSLMS